MSTLYGKIFNVLMTAILILAVYAGVANALDSRAVVMRKANLENVRDFAPTYHVDSGNYAIDGGQLFRGGAMGWTEVKTPATIVGAVAIDPSNPQTVYVGAADELTIYRSRDGGSDWMRIPLTDKYIGGVTDIAVNGELRLVYVGSDTAGIFRLRDVGSSMVLNSHQLLDEPVIEVAADQTLTGLAFIRTRWTLYRSERTGQEWAPVMSLGSAPTALAVSRQRPATIYVGTADRGLLKSFDGHTWLGANEGLGMVPGARLQVDALAVDPTQPSVVYVATSYLYGATQVHQSPVGVALSTDNGQQWSLLAANNSTAIAQLMPVSGKTGAVYAVTNQSRTPMALGNAPQPVAAISTQPVVTTTNSVWLQSFASWLLAAFASAALVWGIYRELRIRQSKPTGALAPQLVQNAR